MGDAVGETVAVAVGETVGDAVGETVGDAVAVGETVGDAVGETVGDAVGSVGAHRGRVIRLLSRLTWPLRASTRPATVVRVCTLIEVSARMLPTKVVSVPSVAELPTCQ